MGKTCDGCGFVGDCGWIDVEDRATRATREFRRATICAACIDRMEPDMWASRGEWESLTPVVPFDRLPPCPPA